MPIRRCFLLRGILLYLLHFGATAAFGEETAWLYWDAPNTNQNVVAYQVFWGTNSGNYVYSDTSFYYDGDLIDGLVMGQTYYFAVAAVDINGNVSAKSQELVYTVPKPTPAVMTTQVITDSGGNPTDLIVNVNWNLPCDWILLYSYDAQFWVPWQSGNDSTSFSADANMAGWGDMVFFRVYLY